MPLSSNDLKLYYNELLIREKRAEAYLDNPARTSIEHEKWMPEFEKILVELNNALEKIKNFKTDEVVLGFNLDKVQK